MKEELNIKDVMVGDWVDVRNDAAPSTPHLERITPSHFLRDEHWYGIEIVPEILEKNGFVPDNFSPYYLSIKDGSVRFSKHQYGLYCNILRPYQRYDGVCNYVHNLQHALRECGIDKEIVL